MLKFVYQLKKFRDLQQRFQLRFCLNQLHPYNLQLKKYDLTYLIIFLQGLNYKDLNTSDIEEHTLIVNCTPLGTYPNIEECPPIPYNGIGKNHLLYDLIYNPSETKFLNYGKKADAKTINGLKMLELQAEKAWEIWHS